MVERVPSEAIEKIVGAKRDPYLHFARAVSDTETVYILHSRDCLDRYSPNLNCHFSRALDAGIEKDHWRWFMDLPVVVTITDNRLRPTQTVDATQRVPRGGTGTQRDAEARKDALLAGKSTSDDLITLDETSAFSVQVTTPPAMSIQAPDGTVLLTIHADGHWEVDTERAPEAAKIFLDEVANYSERLKEAEQRTRTSLRGRESGAQRRREHDPTTTPTEEKS